MLFDQLDVPVWAFRLMLILLGIGFPFALIIDSVREDPRFQAIMKEIGLADCCEL